MDRKVRILTIFGTRPEAIKMAPLVKMLKAENCFDARVCVTAQHRDMLDQVLKTFGIAPDYDLDIMQEMQSLTDITVRTLKGMESVLKEAEPDLVIVHGDTTTTFAGALAAFYRKIQVAHIEAGLRTCDKYSPYPEEMNRQLTSRITDLHFAPTKTAMENLLKENAPGRIFVTGNTVIDAFLSVIERDYGFEDERLRGVDFINKRVLLLTCHRRENLGGNMRSIFTAIRDVVEAHKDVEVVFPVHKNPLVRQTAEECLAGNGRIHRIEPLEYKTFANLISRCHIVLTDSGGLQEEAPAVGKPVLVLRGTTERPEAITAGTALLAGTDYKNIRDNLETLLNDRAAYDKMANAVNPYGDGRACQRIVSGLKRHFGFGGEDFEPFGY